MMLMLVLYVMNSQATRTYCYSSVEFNNACRRIAAAEVAGTESYYLRFSHALYRVAQIKIPHRRNEISRQPCDIFIPKFP